MPIKKSNILVADKILHIGKGETIHAEAMEMQANAIRQKSYDLLNAGDHGRDLVQLIRGKNAQSLLMQQPFEEADTICALVDAEGGVTHFKADGSAMTGTPDSLNASFWQAWTDVTVKDDEYKIALVLSATAYKEYAENKMDQKSDTRFNASLAAIHHRMQLVGV